MKEIDSMIDRSERYIKSAGLRIGDGDYESAVSRVYNAMFYSVEALLLTKDLSFSSHKSVISAFGEHFVKRGIFPKDFRKALTRAFQKRQFSDYEFTFVISKEEADEILAQGKDFISSIVKYLKGSSENI